MADSNSRELQEALATELAPGERLVWSGQPAPWSVALRSVGTFLIGILILSFLLPWTWNGSAGRSDGSFDFGGLFFASVAVFGIGPAVLSPLWAWWVARHTMYAVTDRRVLILERPLRRTTLQVICGDRLTYIKRSEDVLGRGSIAFESLVSKGARGSVNYHDVGLYGLEDARAVADLLPTPTARTGTDMMPR